MNRKIAAIAAIVIALLFAACDLTGTGKAVEYIPPTFEQFLQYEAVAGGDGTYMVEGDILMFSLAEVQAYYDEIYGVLASGQARSSVHLTPAGAWDVWNSTDKLNLTYCIDQKDFVVWRPEMYEIIKLWMLEACANWEQFANVEFKYCPEQDPYAYDGLSTVEFTVRSFNEEDYLNQGLNILHATAFTPSYPENRHVLKLNTDYMIWDEFDHELTAEEQHNFWVNTITHELGHVLGLRHEHVWMLNPDGTYTYLPEKNYDESIAPEPQLLTALDPVSIMAYTKTNPDGLVFTRSARVSPLDGVGVQILYGPAQGRAATFWTVAGLQNGFGRLAPVTEERVLFMEDRLMFEAEYKRLSGSFCIDSLNVNVLNGEIKYSAVFRKNGLAVNPSVLLLDLDRVNFASEVFKRHLDGYRIRTVDTYYYNNEGWYSAVMDKDSGYFEEYGYYPEEVTFFSADSTAVLSDISNELDENRGVQTINYNPVTGMYFVSTRWEPNPQNQVVVTNAVYEVFIAQIRALVEHGYWMTAIDSWTDSAGAARYCGVFKISTARSRWMVCWAFNDYLNYYRLNMMQNPDLYYTWQVVPGKSTGLLTIY